MLNLGYHVSASGGLWKAFERASSVGCTTMQIFASNPRTWNSGVISEEEAKNFKAAGKKHKINPVFIHMPYLPNLSSPNREVYSKSVVSLYAQASSCSALGVSNLVVHLGSSMGTGAAEGAKRLAEALAQAKRDGVSFLLENEAGQRNSVGSTIDELALLLDLAGRHNAYLCIDTCHAFAAGYNIGDAEFIDSLDSTVGIENVKLIHMNDAKYPIGSHRDRHSCIGYGCIGKEAISRFVSDKRIAKIPLVMETPYPDEKFQMNELRLMRSLYKR